MNILGWLVIALRYDVVWHANIETHTHSLALKPGLGQTTLLLSLSLSLSWRKTRRERERKKADRGRPELAETSFYHNSPNNESRMSWLWLRTWLMLELCGFVTPTSRKRHSKEQWPAAAKGAEGAASQLAMWTLIRTDTWSKTSSNRSTTALLPPHPWTIMVIKRSADSEGKMSYFRYWLVPILDYCIIP